MAQNAGVFAADEATVTELAAALGAAGYSIAARATLGDASAIATELAAWTRSDTLAVVLGAAGPAAREVILPLVTRRLLGFSDLRDVDGGRCGNTIVLLVPPSGDAMTSAVANLLPRLERELAATQEPPPPTRVSIPDRAAKASSTKHAPTVPKRIPPAPPAPPPRKEVSVMTVLPPAPAAPKQGSGSIAVPPAPSAPRKEVSVVAAIPPIDEPRRAPASPPAPPTRATRPPTPPSAPRAARPSPPVSPPVVGAKPPPPPGSKPPPPPATTKAARSLATEELDPTDLQLLRPSAPEIAAIVDAPRTGAAGSTSGHIDAAHQTRGRGAPPPPPPSSSRMSSATSVGEPAIAEARSSGNRTSPHASDSADGTRASATAAAAANESGSVSSSVAADSADAASTHVGSTGEVGSVPRSVPPPPPGKRADHASSASDSADDTRASATAAAKTIEPGSDSSSVAAASAGAASTPSAVTRDAGSGPRKVPPSPPSGKGATDAPRSATSAVATNESGSVSSSVAADSADAASTHVGSTGEVGSVPRSVPPPPPGKRADHASSATDAAGAPTAGRAGAGRAADAAGDSAAGNSTPTAAGAAGGSAASAAGAASATGATADADGSDGAAAAGSAATRDDAGPRGVASSAGTSAAGRDLPPPPRSIDSPPLVGASEATLFDATAAVPRGRRRGAALWIALGAGVLVAGGVAYAVLGRSPSPPAQVADRSTPTPTKDTPATTPTGDPEAGSATDVGSAAAGSGSVAGSDDPTLIEIETDTQPHATGSETRPTGTGHTAGTSGRSTSGTSTGRPTGGAQAGSAAATQSTTPAKTEAPVSADGCDKVSCVIDAYARPCCEQYRPRKPGEQPVELDRSMITAGMAKAKAAVIRCGEQSPAAKGIVRIAMKVAPDGSVAEASVSETPDAALGECVATAARNVTFAPTEQGGSFAYPFKF